MTMAQNSSGNTSNTADSGTVTITDNDNPEMIIGDVTIAEDGGSASVPVSIDNPSSVDTVVSITTVDKINNPPKKVFQVGISPKKKYAIIIP